MSWFFLACAILVEVSATLALRMASLGNKLWFIAVGVGYAAAFVLLTLTLAGGIALGVAYGIWAASGVALTAFASRLLFKEPLTRVMGVGIALIIAGVLLIELGAGH